MYINDINECRILNSHIVVLRYEKTLHIYRTLQCVRMLCRGLLQRIKVFSFSLHSRLKMFTQNKSTLTEISRLLMSRESVLLVVFWDFSELR